MSDPRVRKLILTVFLVAAANGLAWSLLTPTFQVPDETAHFAYVQQLAENGTRPGQVGRPEFSSEQSAVQAALGTLAIIGRPAIGVAISSDASTEANSQLARTTKTIARDDGGGPSTAAAQPPLFYASSALVYKMFSWASLPTRLQAIRALSVLFFALAASIITLTVLEVVPRALGASLIAGLSIALSPYCAFIASGVTPDSLLLLTSAAVLFLLSRMFRENVTRSRLVVLGLVVSAGLLTKLTFIAFVPGVIAAVLLLVARERKAARLSRRRALSAVGSAFAAGLAAPLVVLGWLLVTGQPLRPASTAPATLAAGSIPAGSLREFATYAWQLYLPRLPFMTDQFGFSAPAETWLRGFAGRYGWLDYGVSRSFGAVVLWCFYAVGALSAVAVVRNRRVFIERWREVSVVIICTFGLFTLIATAGYDYKRSTGLIFEQPRYLFPIASMYAGIVASATHAFGRRAQPWLAAATIALLAIHNLSGVALTVQRYYG